MIYVTDGSFEGVLTAVFEAYRRKETPDGIVSDGIYQVPLDSEVLRIETDAEKSDRVYQKAVEKMSQEAIEILYRAYLHEHPEVGTAIYRYIREGLRVGRQVIDYLQNPDVMLVNDMSRKVLTEVHLFLGILRFKKLANGIFYARYEPDNNITMLIADHFAERLSDQPWIIHDAKRDIVALYNTLETVFVHEHVFVPPEGVDEQFELLWKNYFKSIAIESRFNPKLQRHFMPRRYWKNLIEK